MKSGTFPVESKPETSGRIEEDTGSTMSFDGFGVKLIEHMERSREGRFV
ncbi:MAG: hypothetical protein L6290_12330 [Thermodesulfovibrionales bacterium]|nr:hypothetical protein [Thermodesulfovibrionales bacterium]